jgi:hypothetical protein
MWSQINPAIKLIAPVHPSIETDSDLDRHAVFAGELASHFSLVRRAAFVLTNKSSKQITGLAVRYILIDATGQSHTTRYRTDSYTLATFVPVLDTSKQMLIAPGVFLAENLADKGRLGVPNYASEKLRPLADLIAGAQSAEAQLDAVIFADGEVVGPDALKFPEEIWARYSAAQDILERLKAAARNGATAEAVLTQYLSTPVSKNDLAGRWRQRFADAVLNAAPRKNMAEWLATRIAPPKFYASTVR